jgi:hypothetical protein
VPVHRALFAHLTVGRIRVGVDPRMHWVETGLSHQDHVRRLQAGFIDSAGRPGINSGLVSSRIGVPAWSPDSGTASAALNVMVESIRRDPEIPRRAFKAGVPVLAGPTLALCRQSSQPGSRAAATYVVTKQALDHV